VLLLDPTTSPLSRPYKFHHNVAAILNNKATERVFKARQKKKEPQGRAQRISLLVASEEIN